MRQEAGWSPFLVLRGGSGHQRERRTIWEKMDRSPVDGGSLGEEMEFSGENLSITKEGYEVR